jgi:dimethylargininase
MLTGRRIALTRPVPDSLAACELTHVSRVPIDVAAARAEHAAYERLLVSLGCHIERLEPAHDLPDSVFVEDTAVVFDEVAIVTRPGAASRRPEIEGVAPALARYRPLVFITEPATLDGGDVLRLGRTLHVGVGARTDHEAIRQLQEATRPYGYDVRPVLVSGCLHLKSAVTAVAPDMLLANPQWIDVADLTPARVIEVDPAEPEAANALRVGDQVVCAAAYPRTIARLQAAGLRVRPLDVSELGKAEAGLTCCSVIFDA